MSSSLIHGGGLDNFASVVRQDDENSIGDFLDMTRDKRGETEVHRNIKTLSSVHEFNKSEMGHQKDKIEEIDEEAKNIQTIDTMCPHVQKLFIIVKKQLMDPEHPLNMVATEFVESYVDFYNEKIHQNIEQFYKTQVNEFQITSEAMRSNGVIQAMNFNKGS